MPEQGLILPYSQQVDAKMHSIWLFCSELEGVWKTIYDVREVQGAHSYE